MRLDGLRTLCPTVTLMHVSRDWPVAALGPIIQMLRNVSGGRLFIGVDGMRGSATCVFGTGARFQRSWPAEIGRAHV